jgi:hypothetical protein
MPCFLIFNSVMVADSCNKISWSKKISIGGLFSGPSGCPRGCVEVIRCKSKGTRG